MKSLYCLLLLPTIIFLSCNQTKTPDADIIASYGGTLKLTLVDPVQTLDPANIIYSSDWRTSAVIYEGLVALGKGLNEIQPCIAKSWQKLDGGKRWIFNLNANVKFHDDPCFPNGRGRLLNARDIVYTFERISSPETNCINWSLFKSKIIGIDDFHKGISNSIKGINVLDSNRIEFELTKPFVTFLKILATPSASIIAREAVEYYGDNFMQHPVGTGPFRLAQWKPMKEILLVKSENYWAADSLGNSLPYIDEIIIKVIPNLSLALSEFLKNESHIIYLSQDQLNDIKKESNFEKKYTVQQTIKATSIRFLGFSLDNLSSFTNNLSIRKAFAYAYDRKSFIQKIELRYNLANSLVPSFLYHQQDIEWYPFDLQQAKRLIKPWLKDIVNDTLNIVASLDTKGLNEFKRCIEALGILSELEIIPARYYNRIIQDRPDIFRVSMVPAYPDPEEYFSLFYSKSGPAINLTQFKNDEFDKIFERSMFEQDDLKRLELFVSLEKILKENLPAIFLTHEKPSVLVHPNFIKGVNIKFGPPDYSTIWIEDEIEN